MQSEFIGKRIKAQLFMIKIIWIAIGLSWLPLAFLIFQSSALIENPSEFDLVQYLSGLQGIISIGVWTVAVLSPIILKPLFGTKKLATTLPDRNDLQKLTSKNGRIYSDSDIELILSAPESEQKALHMSAKYMVYQIVLVALLEVPNMLAFTALSIEGTVIDFLTVIAPSILLWLVFFPTRAAFERFSGEKRTGSGSVSEKLSKTY